MGVVTSLSPSSVIAETIARLDSLQNADQIRRARHRSDLASAVARLDAVGPSPDDSEPARAAGSRDERDRGSARKGTDPAPFVALPQRTTRGGDFGPVVREKLIAEALGKRGW